MSIFSSVPITKLSRSTFNLDHENKLSFNFGGLYPILCQTVLPGDKMSLGVQSFIRTVPLLSPVMHRNDIKLDAFFVPMRLVWSKTEQWLQCTDPTIKMPQMYLQHGNLIAVTQAMYNAFQGVSSLADYLGFASVPSNSFALDGSNNIPDSEAAKRKMCALPFRAYNMIYDYYYRSKTLEDDMETLSGGIWSYDSPNDDIINLDSWPNATFLMKRYQILNRSWRRDPFTSALPDPQKGNPVLMPTGDITPDGDLYLSKGTSYTSDGKVFQQAGTNNVAVSGPVNSDSDLRYSKGLKIDAPTIEDFRYAEVLKEYEEALARSGAGEKGSFKEWLFSIWRTLSPDARLDRPEYLGGYRGPIQISEVPQTSAATATSAQGTLAGKGLSVGGQLLFKNRNFKEPGYLMVIMSVVPKSAYFEGDPRQFLYSNPYDFPNPYFANLGEQEVYTQEIAAASAINNPNQQQTFGYNVRNYEMKQIPDGVHGALRSNLMYWHEGRYFGADDNTTVNLNQTFVKMLPLEVSRIFPSSETSDKLIGEFFFNFRAKRSLPYYGVPRVGHTK